MLNLSPKQIYNKYKRNNLDKASVMSSLRSIIELSKDAATKVNFLGF